MQYAFKIYLRVLLLGTIENWTPKYISNTYEAYLKDVWQDFPLFLSVSINKKMEYTIHHNGAL